MPKQDHIAFPLDTFLERLSIEGIEVSLPQRLQLMAVLRRFGHEALEKPEQLKYKIAPILAKNGFQQKRVHILFEEFIKEARAYEPPPPPIHYRQWQKWPRWQLGLLGLTLLLIPLTIIFWSRLFPAAQHQPMQANFSAPDRAVMGQKIKIRNKTIHFDTTMTFFNWLLVDNERGEVEWDSVINEMEWELPILKLGESQDKLIRLVATDTATKKKSTFETRLQLICTDLPTAPGMEAPSHAAENEVIVFGIKSDSISDLNYLWDFGDGEKGQGASLSHTYSRAGFYRVQLKVSRPEAEGFCETTSSHNITIGRKAYLADEPLAEDPNQGTVSEFNFFWMSWLLLGLLLLFALYHFWRWLNQAPPKLSEKEVKQELDARFSHADKGPYNIPFENEESAIRVEENLFRLADRLRQRQEAGRMVLDIPASVRQTIDQGGFPVLLEKRTTLPPEYLFLVDEQYEGSHQASLYRYLVRFLKDKDIYITTFWYNTSFKRFWNPDFSTGIGLEQLQRLFPHHRLVVLGDGHGLMDPFGEELKVRDAYKEGFKAWPSRLLLTPLPPASWTYKEATIYNLFPIFDSDASGFAAAMKYLDTLAEEEDDPGPRPSFGEWHGEQSQPPEQPDINHRDWKQLDTYTEYLQDYPGLYRWLCALAVYPTPNWNLSLAIGRAIGAPVNFDNLLLLSRIPWLHGQPPSPKLRQQLLDTLDPETANLARATVREALEAVAPKVAGSHANLELQTNLAVLSFLLEPTNPKFRKTIEQLQQHGLLGKKQMLDINSAISRKTNGKITRLPDYISQISGKKGTRAKEGELRVNKHYYLALGAGIWLISLAAMMLFLNGSSILYQLVKGQGASPQIEEIKSPAAYAFFLKEDLLLDSAAIYNNLGVATWQEGRDTFTTIAQDHLAKAIDYFRRALRKRPVYALANNNLSKASYNSVVLAYNDYLEQERDTQYLMAVLEDFRDLLSDKAVENLAFHGLGLCYHNLGSSEEARSIYNSLESIHFFDTLTLEPNLKSFYGPKKATGEGCAPDVAFSIANEFICAGDEVTLINDSDPDQNFEYFLLNWGDGQQDSMATFSDIKHSYTRGSRWTITLTGYINCDSTGIVNQSYAQRIAILGIPKAEIKADVQKGCPPLTVNFSGPSTAGYEYRWRIKGDNNNASEQRSRNAAQAQPQNTGNLNAQGSNTFTHTFTTSGLHEVWLYKTNPCGADSASLSIEVLPPAECAQTLALKGRVLGYAPEDSSSRFPLVGVEINWGYGNTLSDANGDFDYSIPANALDSVRFTLKKEGFETKQEVISKDLLAKINQRTFTLFKENLDPDRDGLTGAADRCPDQPGPRATSGCPDSDGDGVADREDGCPEAAGQMENKGCPIREEALTFDLLFQNSWVKPNNLVGQSYFLSVEDKAYIWPLRLMNDSCLVLINQSRSKEDRKSELFYGIMEVGKAYQFKIGEQVYRVELEKIANAGTVPSQAAFFRVDKARVAGPGSSDSSKPQEPSPSETQAWRSAIETNTMRAYEIYLNDYPSGAYARIAEEFIKKQLSQIGYEPDRKILSLTEPLVCKENIIRTQPTNFGRLTVTAMSEAIPGADVYLINSGFMRLDDNISNLVTEFDILRTFPFGGPIVEMELPGNSLQQLLDTGLKTNRGTGGYLQMIQVEIQKNTYLINGSSLQATKNYKVVLPEFTAEGREQNMEFLANFTYQKKENFLIGGSTVLNDIRNIVIVYFQKLGTY